MRRTVNFLYGIVIGAVLMFLWLERPWLSPEEKTDYPVPLSTYFMGEQ